MVKAEDFHASGTYADIVAFESAERKKIKRQESALTQSFEANGLNKIRAQTAAADAVKCATEGDAEAQAKLDAADDLRQVAEWIRQREPTQAIELLRGLAGEIEAEMQAKAEADYGPGRNQTG